MFCTVFLSLHFFFCEKTGDTFGSCHCEQMFCLQAASVFFLKKFTCCVCIETVDDVLENLFLDSDTFAPGKISLHMQHVCLGRCVIVSQATLYSVCVTIRISRGAKCLCYLTMSFAF